MSRLFLRLDFFCSVAWCPPTSIEDLFECLVKGQKFAAQGDEEIIDDQIVRWGYNVIKTTKMFDLECAKWRKKDVADRT